MSTDPIIPETPSIKCPQCGSNLANSSPGTPCQACLLQLGMRTWTEDDPQATQLHASRDPAVSVGVCSGRQGASPSLKAKFPQLEILHLVGSGGMGDVYCARQKSLNRLVALKIIRPESQQAMEFAGRFVREAQALAQLSHPNIVTVHDFGESSGVYYFIMEYVDGINLRQMLRGGKLGPKQALQIVPAVCDALQYAHDKGIVHRDIKPENILIDTDGKIKIADFGLAKLLDQKTATPALTQAHQVMGTMHYMAPEQFERPLDVDHRADIYSLGVVIYELLTGELPLGRFALPSEKSSADTRLDQIVMQTLEKEPSLRYQQVSQIKTDMQSVGANQRVAQPQPVPHEASPRRVAHQEYPQPAASFQQPAARPMAPVKHGNHASPSELPGAMPRGGLLAGIADAQTYRNLLYMLISFPLGLIYFVLMIVGLSLGIGTLIIWIGVAILLGTFLLVRSLTALDRLLVRGLLRTSIPSLKGQHTRLPANASWYERARSLMSSRESWAAIGYILVKFPMSILSFVITLTLIPICLSLLALPMLVLILDDNAISIGNWDVNRVWETIPFFITGFVLSMFSVKIINGLAWIHAQWARLCLTHHQPATQQTPYSGY